MNSLAQFLRDANGGREDCLLGLLLSIVSGEWYGVLSGFLIGCQAQCYRMGVPHVILTECI